MRWFTVEWWMGQCGGDAAAEYQLHFESIRGRLPEALRRVSEEVPLHDAHLRRLVLADGVAEAKLDVLGPGSQRSSVTLRYLGVSRCESSGDPDRGLAGPYGYGDLGYDEIDIGGDRTFVHRLLFSSGIELHFHFADFEYVLATAERT